MRVGRRLAIKLLNASRFVLGLGTEEGDDAAVPEPPAVAPVDGAMLTRMAAVVAACTTALDELDYTRALDRAETEFWWWTDNYVELVKGRAYESDDGARSAHRSLRAALSIFLRLFAPFLPFVTEEVWSWWQPGSIHRSPWPVAEVSTTDGDPATLDLLAGILATVRRTKTEAQVSMRAPLHRLVVSGPAGDLDRIAAGLEDLARAANVAEVATVVAADTGVEVVLAG
jgi:valyl-tRNA synthetase